MSEQATEKKSKIASEILRISAVIDNDMTLSDTNGRKGYTLTDETFVKTLPEGQTVDQYRAMGEHLDNVVAGSNHAFGVRAGKDIAACNFNKDEDLETLDMHMPLWGKNFIESTYTKELVRTNVNPQNKEEKIVTTKHGDIRTALKMNASQNRGQLKHVRNEVSDMAADAFAKANK